MSIAELGGVVPKQETKIEIECKKKLDNIVKYFDERLNQWIDPYTLWTPVDHQYMWHEKLTFDRVSKTCLATREYYKKVSFLFDFAAYCGIVPLGNRQTVDGVEYRLIEEERLDAVIVNLDKSFFDHVHQKHTEWAVSRSLAERSKTEFDAFVALSNWNL